MLQDIRVLKEELLEVPTIEADKLLAMANSYRSSMFEHAKHFGHMVHKGNVVPEEFQLIIDESQEFYYILNFLRANDLVNQEDVDYCHRVSMETYISCFVEGILEEERGETENE